MTGFARTGGNKRGKKPPKKPRQHFDKRMQLGIADMKRLYPGMCAVPKNVKLMDEQTSQKLNRPNDNSHK